VRRSSRAAASAKNYNEDNIYKELEEQAMEEARISKTVKRKQPSGTRKVAAEEDEEGEDDEQDEVVVEVDDGSSHEGDMEGSEDSRNDDDQDEEDNAEEEGDVPTPRILARRQLTAAEWREVCGCMNTKEITRG